jgi:hypothetical protein
MSEPEVFTATEYRQMKLKEQIIEELKKVPIIQIVCEKVGVGRATFYRWKKDDKVFAEAVDEALNDGSGLVSDLAESKLIAAIKQENMTAIIFWLRNHHAKYANKVEVTANVKNIDQSLTPEQQAIVEQALKLANLTNEPDAAKDSNEPNSTGTPSTDISGS